MTDDHTGFAVVRAGVSDHHLLFSDKEEHVPSDDAPSSSSGSTGAYPAQALPRQGSVAAAQRRAAPAKPGGQQWTPRLSWNICTLGSHAATLPSIIGLSACVEAGPCCAPC